MHLYAYKFQFKSNGFSYLKPGYAMSSKTRYTPKMLETFGRHPDELRQWNLKEIVEPIHISHEYKWVATEACKWFEKQLSKRFPPESTFGTLSESLGIGFYDVIQFSGMTELVNLKRYGYSDNWEQEFREGFWPKFSDWVNKRKDGKMKDILEKHEAKKNKLINSISTSQTSSAIHQDYILGGSDWKARETRDDDNAMTWSK